MERFGLSCYGCCEPLDQRIDIVKTASNLRRVSVSPWANKRLMAEKLSSKYIYSMKPTPAFLAVPHIEEEAARKELRDALQVIKEYDCRPEFIMKDNHTLGKNPENLKTWVRIAREEIMAFE
jgi:hypothetical protein